ncbi:MAG: NAD/NADP octopine/nopaline dehydrogenase family protein [Anaerolineaceae bacterium]|nr:NAD/NADP octopine/nopaline dehydrogenase family protein [Anaerolineaceae bacterium]
MKFCVYGAGNTGHALSAYLASKGADFVLYTRDPQKAETLRQHGLESAGAIAGHFAIEASADLEKLIPEVDYILVMTTANAHKDAAARLKPLLRQGQKVLIFNSNWGAFEFMQILGQDVRSKQLTVAETAAQLFVGNLTEPGKVTMNVKSSVSISATEPSKTAGLIDALRNVFPQFLPAESIIATTLSSTNPVIHVPISILNLVRIENRQPFLFYGEGVSGKAVENILHIDAERVALGRALGCHVDDVLTAINSFWEVKHDNLFDALTKNTTYLKTQGPASLSHRYFTEDVPYGIAPIAKIGKLFGLATPYTDRLLDYLKSLMGGKLELDAMYFAKEDFASLVP